MSEIIKEYILEEFAFLRGIHMAKYQVSWSTSQCWRDTLRFSSFYRFGDDKGNGRLALEEVCALADRYRLDLSLFTEFVKLIPYYESFGFVKDEKRSYPDYWEGIRTHVVRESLWETPISKHLPTKNFWTAVNRHA